MGSRRIACSFFLGVGLAVVVALTVPTVRLPYIVVHGPVSTLEVERPTWSLTLPTQAPTFLLAHLTFLPATSRLTEHANDGDLFMVHPLRSNFPLRC